MNLPLPTNLPFLIHDPRPDARACVSKLLSDGDSMAVKDILLVLGLYWPVRVWFSEPVTIRVIPRWLVTETSEDGRWKSKTRKIQETADSHVFRSFFPHRDSICYSFRRPNRTYRYQRQTGWYCDWLDKVIRYEPVIRRNQKGELKA